jgi:choline dehydrogenase
LIESPEVGANLQDHLGVSVTHRSLKPVTLYGLMRPDRALLAGAQALLFGAGPATSCPLEAGGFLKTDPGLAIPDVHVIVSPGLSLAANRGEQREHGFTTTAYQLRPLSRGHVAITSADPAAAPLIDPNYLGDPADRVCLRQGLKLVRRILSQPGLDAFRGPELSPGIDIQDDAGLDAYIAEAAKTVFHPAGTCRMGKDERAVVDETLKVRGVAGLRVADASVMPTVIGGNTSLPTMMIAERCAALIVGAR